MSNFNDMIKKLQQDNEVPQQVLDRLDKVLENLPDCHGHDRDAQIAKKERMVQMEKNRKSEKKANIWQKATAVAAVLAVGCVVCYSNPVLASRIPFLSNVFETIENDIPFSGNYSQKAAQLEAADTGTANDQKNASAKGTERTVEKGITVSDSNITITASEVYCDGLSVFLSAQVYAAQGGFTSIPSHSVNDNDTRSDSLYLRGDWKLSNENDSHPLTAHFLEGKVIDDHTFAGMIKLDLNTKPLEQDTLYLQLSDIGWDDIAAANAEDISETHRIEGNWDFTVPFHTDTESVKEIEVNKEQNGFAIRKVFVSSYQVVSYIDAPITHIEKNISRADYEEKLGLKEGEEAPDMSYQQYIDMQTVKIQPCETVVCDQNGRLLPMGDMSTTSGTTTFAVNKKELKTLHIFVFTDYENYEKPDGTIDMETAPKRAVVSAEISVD